VFGGFAGIFTAAAWYALFNLNAQNILISGVNAAYGKLQQQGEQICNSALGGQ
jgi:hypothetical protein